MGTVTEKVPEPGIFHISGGIGTGIGKIWYQKKSRNQYRYFSLELPIIANSSHLALGIPLTSCFMFG